MQISLSVVQYQFSGLSGKVRRSLVGPLDVGGPETGDGVDEAPLASDVGVRLTLPLEKLLRFGDTAGEEVMDTNDGFFVTGVGDVGVLGAPVGVVGFGVAVVGGLERVVVPKVIPLPPTPVGAELLVTGVAPFEVKADGVDGSVISGSEKGGNDDPKGKLLGISLGMSLEVRLGVTVSVDEPGEKLSTILLRDEGISLDISLGKSLGISLGMSLGVSLDTPAGGAVVATIEGAVVAPGMVVLVGVEGTLVLGVVTVVGTVVTGAVVTGAVVLMGVEGTLVLGVVAVVGTVVTGAVVIGAVVGMPVAGAVVPVVDVAELGALVTGALVPVVFDGALVLNVAAPNAVVGGNVP
jgi:hypothetical protein